MAPQLQAVLTCLSQTQQPDPQGIKHAEAELQALAMQPGFGAALTQIALASQEVAPAHLRQLAAVLLKQYVKQHWISGERGFVAPETSTEEKAQIRAALPAGLHDPDSKIRTAIAMAIAAVANWDWPQDWPGLLENIVSSIKERRDPNLVAGCLRCLKVMAADVDSEQAPGLLESLSAELAEIVTNPQTPAGLAATCFNIMAQLTSALASLAGKYQRQVRDLLVPLVQPWVPLICSVLATDPGARTAWPVNLGALRLGLSITSYFSKPLSAAMPHLMSATWQLLLALQPLHQSILVEGQGDDEVDQLDEGLDADEEPVGLEMLLAQLLELLTTFVEKPLLKPQVAAALKDMMYVTIAYLQMTQEQAETWVHSATQFVEDEDTDYTACRSCAQQLVVAVAEAFEDSGALPAVLEGVVRRWAEADADAAAGKLCWWQMREAGMLAASSCEATEFSPEHVQQLLDQLLQRDLQPLLQQQQHLGDAGQQFVMSRALKLGAYLHDEATAVHKQQLLQAAAVAVMSQAATPPLRLLGYKALAQLAPAVPPQHLAPLVTQLLPALLQQLAVADEESLHLVLELLHVVIEAASTPGNAGLAPEQALAVAQPVLQVWLQHTSDPLIAPDAQEVIGALANHSQCLPSLIQAAAPTLAAILQRGAAMRLAKQQGQSAAAANAAAAAAASAAAAGLHLPEETAMLVEASLDLLGALVKPGQDATTLELCRGVLGPVLSLIQSSGDASELSSAVSLLLKFLRTCPTQQLLVCAASSPAAAAVASSGGAEEAGLAALVVTARQLLAPSQQDGAVRLAGPLLAQMLKVLPQQLCSALPTAATASSNGSAQVSGSCVAVLLYDTVVRMASAESCSPRTVAHLLEFVVRLVLLPAVGAQGVVELLAAMSLPRQDGSSVNGLCVLMPLWLDHAADMVGALQTKQCAAALMEMLKLRHHPALAGVAVQGRLLDVDSGRLTRSKAKQQGGLRYSQVPATAKVLQVLGALLSTEAEPAAGGMQFGAGVEGLWGSEDGGDADSDTSGSYEEEELEGAAMEHLGNAAVLKAAGLAASASNEDILRASWQDVMDRSASATPAPEDPSDAQDPLSAVSTRNIIKQGLSALAAADSAFLAASAEHLGPCRELQVLQELLK